MKKILYFLGVLVLTPVFLFAMFLLYVTLSDYKPEPIEQISSEKGQVVSVRDTFNVFDWNIGYCGLGDDMSFFYDGGENVRTSEQRTQLNAKHIFDLLKQNADTIDFYLLQEVDQHSKRSYFINQFDLVKSSLQDFYSSFAYNYKVVYIPVPPSNPLGKVEGGLASLSRFQPKEIHRFSFEGNYAWPKGLFLLDRCFKVQRFSTSNGKELLIINTHNSAYDDGSLRLRQMEMMKAFLQNEYAKGNYILVGGDWNQKPPSKTNDAKDGSRGHLTDLRIPMDFMPASWHWVSNNNIPTNRLINEAYNPKTTETSVIDFFLLSPNLYPVFSKNLDLKFQHSDHQPVLLRFTFRP